MRKTVTRKVLLVIVLLTCAVVLPAQTKRKTSPKPLATPLPSLTGAEIISRAGDYEDPSTVTVPVEKPKTTTTSTRIKNLQDRIDKLESAKKEDPDAKQRRMLLNLDILTRAEQRSESLRKQLFEMTEKENTIKTRLDQIDVDSRPEMIERTLQMAGSMHPEEIREAKKRSLDAERANLESLLTQIQSTKGTLSMSLDKADAMVEKLRSKLDKEIDDTFLKDDQPEP